MNLKARLTASFIISIFLSVAIVSGMGYFQAKSELATNINSNVSATVSGYVQKMDGWLLTKAKMVVTVGNMVKDVSGSAEVPRNYLNVYKTDSEVSDLYVGYPTGKFVDGSGWNPPPDFNASVRPWYKKAVEKGTLVFSDPYVDAITKEYVVTAALPIKDAAGNVQTVTGADILLTTLTKEVKNINLGGKGFAVLTDTTGVILSHPDQKLVGKKLSEEESTKAIAGNLLSEANQGSFAAKLADGDYMVFFERLPSTGWVLALYVPESVLTDPLQAMAVKFGTFGLIMILLVALYAAYFARKLTAPLVALTEGAQKMAHGDLRVQIAVNSADELGMLANAFNEMGSNLRRLARDVLNSSQQVAASSEELTASSEQSAQTINQVVQAISEVAHGTETQQKAVVRTEEAFEQMSTEIKEVARQAGVVSELTSRSSTATVNGEKAVDQSVAQMNSISQTTASVQSAVDKLADSSKQIGEIVDVIANIAGQTNLLALNAAIEAARAGEQGRGFAVVAEEVRKLAEQSQEAAKQIAELIGSNRHDIDNAVASMQAGSRDVASGIGVVNVAGKAFAEIKTLIHDVSEQVQSMAASVQQIANKSQEIVISVKEVGKVSRETAAQTQTVSAASEEQSASMEEIASASRSLAQMADELQTIVNKFHV